MTSLESWKIQCYECSKINIFKEILERPWMATAPNTVGPEKAADLLWLPNVDAGTSRRAAGTGPWSCGLEPTYAVSPHAGNSPWRKKGGGGYLFPSIHFDISPLSRKHSSGTARRLIRASFSAKATCFEVGDRSMSETGFSLACASIQALSDRRSC